MEFWVERKLKLSKYSYSIDLNKYKSYYAEANYTFGIWLRKIKIVDEKGNSVYILKQTNLLLKFLTAIFSVRLFPEYKFYNKGLYNGKVLVKIFTPEKILLINNCKYELYLHSNNYVSIMKDGTQIGLVKKDVVTIAEKNKYFVLCDEKSENDALLFFLLTVFTDIIYFPNRLRVDYYKYEKTVGYDKLYERTLWKPNSF